MPKETDNSFVGFIHGVTENIISFTKDAQVTLEAVTELGQAVENLYETIIDWWDGMTMHSVLLTTKEHSTSSLVSEINTAIANNTMYDVNVLGIKIDCLANHVQAKAASYWGKCPLKPGYVVKGTTQNYLHMYHVQWHNPWFLSWNDPTFYLSPGWAGKGVTVAGFAIEDWVGCVMVQETLDLPQTPHEAENFVTQKIQPTERAPGLFDVASDTTTSSKLVGTVIVVGLAGLLIYMAMK